jgi:hypothetical protein
MVEQTATVVADPTLSNAVLPRASEGNDSLVFLLHFSIFRHTGISRQMGIYLTQVTPTYCDFRNPALQST